MRSPSDIAPTGDAHADVRAVFHRTATFLADPLVADAVAGLAADAVRDPLTAERLGALLAARRADETAVLLSATARGDLRSDTDVPLLLDVVFGALLFRLGRGTPPTPAVVDALVDLVLRGQGAPGDQPVDRHQPDGQLLDGHRLDGHRLDGHRNGVAADPLEVTDGRDESRPG
jgi:Tetracyclin repressor-like, C-terminal domain